MKKLVFITLSLIVLVLGCTNKGSDSETNSEGTLEYKIVYPPQMIQDGITTFLPDKMLSFFKNDQIKIRLKGGLGIYNLEYISRALGDTCFTLFKVFDKKMYYEMDKREPLFLFEELGSPHVELITDSVKIIAGFPCYQALVTFPETQMASIKVFYTKEFKIKKPNINTPFDKIPGVLMEFDVTYKTLKLKMVAEEFTPVVIAASEFCIPEDYTKSTAKEIQGFIQTLLQ